MPPPRCSQGSNSKLWGQAGVTPLWSVGLVLSSCHLAGSLCPWGRGCTGQNALQYQAHQDTLAGSWQSAVLLAWPASYEGLGVWLPYIGRAMQSEYWCIGLVMLVHRSHRCEGVRQKETQLSRVTPALPKHEKIGPPEYFG